MNQNNTIQEVNHLYAVRTQLTPKHSKTIKPTKCLKFLAN